MDHIETKILNCFALQEAAKNMVFTARLTQQGHMIQNMKDLKNFIRNLLQRKPLKTSPVPLIQQYKNLLLSPLLLLEPADVFSLKLPDIKTK